MDYVRKAYSMPWLKRGLGVMALGRAGTVTSASHYVHVRLDGEKRARRYHPNDVKRFSSTWEVLESLCNPDLGGRFY